MTPQRKELEEKVRKEWAENRVGVLLDDSEHAIPDFFLSRWPKEEECEHCIQSTAITVDDKMKCVFCGRNVKPTAPDLKIDWEGEFDKEFPAEFWGHSAGASFRVGVFIKNLLSQKESQVLKVNAASRKFYQMGYDEGESDVLSKVKEVVASLKKEVKGGDVTMKEMTQSMVDVGYNSAIEDILSKILE